jgi:serine/threonine protein phosphatase 1
MRLRMLKRFFRNKAAEARPHAPQGHRAYAVGDVHGRLDLLEQLLLRIEDDNASRGPAKTHLVLLGDLIDRGADSKGVIDLFLERRPSFAKIVFLKGNHEEFFLEAMLGDLAMMQSWLGYGGTECAASYGIGEGWIMNSSPSDIWSRLADAVPQSHIEFVQDMADTFRFGDYLFVHAGIRPGIPLDQQVSKDLRWIREGFLEDRTDHGMTVIHGHTIVKEVEELPNRIGIDTGAYRTGVLTAIGIEEDRRWFIQAKSDPSSD